MTKTMENAMIFFGKDWLEASVGRVIRQMCQEHVTIEVDPSKTSRGVKDVDHNVKLLSHWCEEFWKQIYAVRDECPK